MPLPADFYVPTRQDIKDQHARDVKIRQPGAKTGPGSLADLDGANIADHLLPVHANAVRTFHNTNLADADEGALEAKAVARGLPARLPPSGGSGYVLADAPTTGVFIASGAIIKDDKTNLRFKCTVGRSYVLDEPVPISGIDTGPLTNIAAGTKLRWESPPPGLGELATIQADPNGDGLTGGRDKESIDELRARIADDIADPADASNAAEIRRLVKEAGVVHGIPMQEVFVYSAIDGTNTYAWAFTLRPARAGASRTPNDVQLAQVRAFVIGELPHGDGIFPTMLLESNVEILLTADWLPGATGWADLTPYPQYDDVSPAVVSAVTSATAFQVDSLDTPQVGQTMAFYNAAEPPVFVRKKILTVAGAGPFDLTIDTTLNVSDLTYVPTIDERFCPWSDSLALLVTPVLERFDGLGPGEQFDDADLFDPGERLRRNPAPPDYPNELTHRVLKGLDEVTVLSDVAVLEPTLPYRTPTGTPSVSSFLLACTRILAFP